MYELKQGTARIIGALEDVAQDKQRYRQLVGLLNYVEGDQLRQDVEALGDFWEIHREEADD